MKLARGAAVFVLASALAAACTNVLGLNDYESAAATLCGPCDDIPECEARLNDALAGASPAETDTWLKTYDQLNCANAACGAEEMACFFAAPGLCSALDEPCNTTVECCGSDESKPENGPRCCAGGDGTCCATCLSCAERLGQFLADVGAGDSGGEALCLSHQPAWTALAECKQEHCKLACGSKLTCVTCMNENCKPQVDACNQYAAP